jgi:hypothetical protein
VRQLRELVRWTREGGPGNTGRDANVRGAINMRRGAWNEVQVWPHSPKEKAMRSIPCEVSHLCQLSVKALPKFIPDAQTLKIDEMVSCPCNSIVCGVCLYVLMCTLVCICMGVYVCVYVRKPKGRIDGEGLKSWGVDSQDISVYAHVSCLKREHLGGICVACREQGPTELQRLPLLSGVLLHACLVKCLGCRCCEVGALSSY